MAKSSAGSLCLCDSPTGLSRPWNLLINAPGRNQPRLTRRSMGNHCRLSPTDADGVTCLSSTSVLSCLYQSLDAGRSHRIAPRSRCSTIETFQEFEHHISTFEHQNFESPSSRIPPTYSSRMTSTAPDPATTAWPSSTTISARKKTFLVDYFRLFDTNDPHAGEKIAELFTEDGRITGAAGTLQGPERSLQSL